MPEVGMPEVGMPEVRIKRIYADAAPDDGRRILIDRLWPRGVSKAKAQFDDWVKDLAPSAELRKQYHGAPGRFDEFVAAYTEELRERTDVIERELRLADGVLTLLYASANEAENHAMVLRDVMQAFADGSDS